MIEFELQIGNDADDLAAVNFEALMLLIAQEEISRTISLSGAWFSTQLRQRLSARARWIQNQPSRVAMALSTFSGAISSAAPSGLK